MNRIVLHACLALAATGAFATSARAQYYRPGNPVPVPPPIPFGYNPYFGGGLYGRQGGAMMGAAAMANSYGNVITSQEEARTMREQANQAKIDTKRKAFDEMNYEKANTPTWTEKQSKVIANTTARILLQPKEPEIISGFAMNYVMPTLRQMVLAGVPGPYLPLDPDMIAKINVTVGENGNNLGIFKDGKPLEWPYALLGPTQKKLDAKLSKAIYNAKQGASDPKLLRETRILNEDLLGELKKKLHKEEIDGGEYLQGKRFIEKLTDGINGLSQPYASRVLDGTYHASGKSVPEVVMNMTSNGLRFAPATPGDEPSYMALHAAMAAFFQQATSGAPSASLYPR